ncbi:acetyltransferase [Clostridium nigeriense]|uniref:acetyltransferase n=1 Tax=Clostridium nigeriense TaxID=1805470 RepID=UPI003D33047D
MEKIVLIGAGGHCKSVLDSLLELRTYEVVGITDIKNDFEVMGVKVIGSDDILENLFKSGVSNAFISLGSIGNTSIRRKIYNNLRDIGYNLPRIIDKTAIVSKYATLEDGVFVGKGAIINAGSYIGSNSIINSGSIVEHDCKIGKFVHVAPGVTMSGGASIGNDSHVGTGASIIQGISIGKNSIIGAGSVIVRNIEDNCKVYGNPGRKVVYE